MHKDIKFIYILSFLMIIFSCNKQSIGKSDKTNNNQSGDGQLSVQEIFDYDNSNTEVEKKSLLEVTEKEETKEKEEDLFKTYTFDNFVSDELLKEIEFDGKLCLYDLTVNDTEEEACEKLGKYFDNIKKELGNDGVDYYSENGVFDGEADFYLGYYNGKFVSFEKKNLSQQEIQEICDKLNIGCDISKLRGKEEYYKFKAGKFRFWFLLYYGQYSYSVFDTSKNP